MNDCVHSKKHIYHIDSCVGKHPLADTYRVFTRRKTGHKIKRRYYAALQCHCNEADPSFNTLLNNSAASMPYPVHEVERFSFEGTPYVVIARGKEKDNSHSPLDKMANKGILIVLLAIVIVWLLFF